eukprot:TRINITY_DN1651_c7_g1_i2.p1 TRINITY_DN1651_c7_g1~~TRINITY_DN1651_c7_g1_i2.p1  ORF type:complete len:380 (-),score=33.82 TRINITY_DN1651_c7_g1_i2:60-1199(-)
MEKNDNQPNHSPVQDIIDPDLFPYIIPNAPSWDKNKIEDYKHLIDIEKKGELRHRQVEGDLQQFMRDVRGGIDDEGEYREKIITRVSSAITTRNEYQWIPSDFLIDRSGHVSIVSPVHNLPRVSANRALYAHIARVFEAMVPMFKKLNLINSDKETKLQVIVKAQSYLLEPGMSYAGRWHTEGQTEHIVAAGVYYAHVDSLLEGGALKFRPMNGPQPYYEIQTDHEVHVKQGAAIVFSNTIPHRFRKIANNSSQPGRRTFLNFFVVDPARPIIPKWDVHLHADKLVVLLTLLVRRLLDKHLPLEIAEHIATMIPPNGWNSLQDARNYRARVRQSMTTNKSGWGWINWGNCGTVAYVPDHSVWTHKAEVPVEGLRHTESD